MGAEGDVAGRQALRQGRGGGEGEGGERAGDEAAAVGMGRGQSGLLRHRLMRERRTGPFGCSDHPDVTRAGGVGLDRRWLEGAALPNLAIRAALSVMPGLGPGIHDFCL